jgi:hypothetical protein
MLSLQCLGRACRIFLRLYSPSEFSSSQTPNLRRLKYTGYFLDPWQRPSEKQWFTGQLGPLLARDLSRYCKDCRAARLSRTWRQRVDRLTSEILHCSSCRIDHPKAVFSARELQNSQSSSRICIGPRDLFAFACIE